MPPNQNDYLEIAHQRAIEKKTHVSFPQLKYPSLRDEGFKHPVKWLMGKAMDDGAEGLWRVHNGIYDLRDFVKKHPGGAEWLELSKGTDITEAFECHHLNQTAYKMLKTFYVREAKTPRNSPFTFHEDGFYKSFKRAAVEELKKVPAHAHKRADMIIDGLFTTLLLSSAFACYTTHYWASMFSYMIASLAFAWMMVAAHNYIHRKTNWRMYLFNLSLWSYRDFRVSHVFSHHLYPNTLMDLETSEFEPVVVWNPRKDKPFLSQFAIFIQQMVFPFFFFINFFKRFLCNFLRKGFFTEHYRWHDGIGFLLPTWMWLVSGTSLSNAVSMWLWIFCTASFIFFWIGVNAAHHHPDVWKDGDQVRSETIDWGIHEMVSVIDRTDINSSLFRVMTFFGDHAMHHFFPTLDHAVLPYLYPVFFEYCEKFKTKYQTTTAMDVVIGQLAMTLKRQPKLLKDVE